MPLGAKPSIATTENAKTKSKATTSQSNLSKAAADRSRSNLEGAQPAETGPKEDVWVLEQQNGQIGKMTIYAGQNAVRIRIGNTGGHIIAKAPDWKVTAFNLNDKTVYESTYDKFVKQELPSLIATSDYFEGRPLKPEKITYFGQKALQVSAPTPRGSTVGMMMPSYSGVGNESPTSKSKTVTVIASEESPVSKQSMSVIRAIYRLPKFGGFPLGVVFKHEDGSSGFTLKTYSMKKQKIATSFFTCSTKGFEHVKTAETALLYGLFDSSFMETP